jgi:hypothetical protein
MQLHHQRGEHELAGLCARDQRGEHARVVDDVGVGEEDVVGRRRLGRGRVHALLHRPELAGPAGGQRLARHDLEPSLGAGDGGGVAGDGGGPVAAVVIDQDDGPFAGIGLREQRREALRDSLHLVAGRDDRGHARPGGGLRGWDVLTLGGEPEAAVGKCKVEPDRDRQCGYHQDEHGIVLRLAGNYRASAAATVPGTRV